MTSTEEYTIVSSAASEGNRASTADLGQELEPTPTEVAVCEENLQVQSDQDTFLEKMFEAPAKLTLDDMKDVEGALHALLRRVADLGLPEEQLRKLRYKLVKPRVNIAVLALMKAGKSTLLNALLHAEFLPSASQPATASITHIQHRPDLPQGRLTVTSAEDAGDQGRFEGREQIHAKLKSINESRRADLHVPQVELLL